MLRYTTWEEFKDAIKEHDRDYYKSDRAFNGNSDLKQTYMVQKYRNDIDRLNVSAKMTSNYWINIILNIITTHLHWAIAYYEDLRSDPSELKKNLLHTDCIPIKFQEK